MCGTGRKNPVASFAEAIGREFHDNREAKEKMKSILLSFSMPKRAGKILS